MHVIWRSAVWLVVDRPRTSILSAEERRRARSLLSMSVETDLAEGDRAIVKFHPNAALSGCIVRILRTTDSDGVPVIQAGATAMPCHRGNPGLSGGGL